MHKLFLTILVDVYQSQRKVKRSGLEPAWLDDTLLYLYDTLLLNKDNLEKLLTVFSIHPFAIEIKKLYEGDALTHPNFDDICFRFSASEKDIEIVVNDYSTALVAIENAGYELTAAIRNLLRNVEAPGAIANLVLFFSKKRMLDSALLEWLLRHEKSEQLWESVQLLEREQCFTIDNLDRVKRYQDVFVATGCLVKLLLGGNYTVANLDTAMLCQQPYFGVDVITLLEPHVTPEIQKKDYRV